MAKKKKIPEKYQIWINVRKRYHLSHAHIQMARELGMNPKKFGQIANHKQEPWKAPLPVFIENLYFKRFGKTRPDDGKSIEQIYKAQEKKKAEHRARKQSSQIQQRVLNREQTSITGEANYIIGRAKNNDTRVVSLGSLVLFSTETGDAWMLDPEDGFALCLAKGGEAQPFTINETTTNFSIEWNADYRIEGNVFVIAERSGQIKSILGYPTKEILRAIRLVRR